MVIEPLQKTLQSSLSVVIPVYHNDNTLMELTTRLDKTCASLFQDFEFIFVDDSGLNSSAEILKSLSSENKRVKIISHDFNRGQQEAIRSGLKLSRGNYVVVLDADLQDPPEIITKLYRKMTSGQAQAVFAVRPNAYQNTIRMTTSKLFKRIVRWLTELPIGAGCFVIMNRKMVNAVLDLKTQRFYLPGLICQTDLSIDTVPYQRCFRKLDKSTYSGVMRLQTAISNIQCLRERK